MGTLGEIVKISVSDLIQKTDALTTNITKLCK